MLLKPVFLQDGGQQVDPLHPLRSLKLRIPRVSLLLPQGGHETHALALVAVDAPRPHVLPQQLQDLALLPALGHGPVRGAEVADRLRPLAGGGFAGGGDVLCLGRVGGGERLALGGPVVDVPVVLVHQ